MKILRKNCVAQICKYAILNRQIITCHKSLGNLFLCAFHEHTHSGSSAGWDFHYNRRKVDAMGFLSPKSHCKLLSTIYVIFGKRIQALSVALTKCYFACLLRAICCWFGFSYYVLKPSFMYSLPWLVYTAINWDPKDAVIIPFTFSLP